MLTRLGLVLPDPGPGEDHDSPISQVVRAAQTAEKAGFDSLWVAGDRGQNPGAHGLEGWSFEAYTLLGALAVRTDSARLGALVTPVTDRNPSILAKQVTALDVLSSGRTVLGIGAGAGGEEANPQGYDRLEEALAIIRALLAGGPVSFEGKHYEVGGAVNRPRPVQKGGLPILIGGTGRKILSLAVRYGDAVTFTGDLGSVRDQLDILDSECDSGDRDPSTITKILLTRLEMSPSSRGFDHVSSVNPGAGMDPGRIVGNSDSVSQQVAEFLNSGIQGLIVSLPDPGDPESVALTGEVLLKSFGLRTDS